LSAHFLERTGFLSTGFLYIDAPYLRFAFHMIAVLVVAAFGILLVTHPVERIRRRIADTTQATN
jgi:hypothetical protein